jgi:hypothetical protein
MDEEKQRIIQADHRKALAYRNLDWTAESLVPRDPNVPGRFYFDRSKIK